MKRNSFLKLCLTFGTLLSTSFISMSKPFKERATRGIKVDAGQDRFGKLISLFQGDTFFCKVSSKDTDGDLYIFESTRDKKGGPAKSTTMSKTNGGTFWKENFYLKLATKRLQLRQAIVYLGRVWCLIHLQRRMKG